MSWLFGIKKPQVPGSDNVNLPPPPTPPSDSNKGKEKIGYGFSSESLERAAKAAKRLEQSKHAREAFDLSKLSETTAQLEYQKKIKEYELSLEQVKLEQTKVQQEERRKTLQEETKQHKSRAQYQDQLARKRDEDQLAQHARMQEENLRKQEESVKKQEEMRKKTAEYEAKLRLEGELKRVQAEIDAQANAERTNRDIRMEQLKAKASENRTTVLESIKTVGDVIGGGLGSLVRDWDKLTALASGVTMMAVGIYASKYGMGVLMRQLESRFSRPSLVRETSKLSVIDSITQPIATVKNLLKTPEDSLKGIIFNSAMEARLRDITIATRHTKKNMGLYRNILFYGPPGTGKTMFAKSLALHSGMHYAVMTGGDVAPMGKDGVSAIHKMFDWSEKTRKGLILFIDEADAFLRKRSTQTISEDMRSSLNAFLYRSGQQSNKFMIVLASNQPEQLDWAINDRVDEIIEFAIPTLEERDRMVRMYFDKFILTPASLKKSRLKVDSFDYGNKCLQVADKLEGFSGREISKLVISWQSSAYASASGVLTEDIMDACVVDSLVAHSKRTCWMN